MSRKSRGRKHIVIPDTQVKPGVPINHLTAIGNYIADQRPDVIVHLGDHWDMPSLSLYDKRGSAAFEGRRYAKDVAAGNEAMHRLVAPYRRLRSYKPRQVFLLGNHEERINRAINLDPILEGTIGIGDLALGGWEVHPFLEIAEIDGVMYCLTPEARVLTADLRWVPGGELKVGDRLLAFDEDVPQSRTGRRYKEAVVEAAVLDKAETFRVTLSNGDTIDATAEHRWLCKPVGLGYVWRETRQLLDRKTYVPKPLSPWQDAPRDYDTGWLAGLLDGEGHVAVGSRSSGLQVCLAQNEGPVLERAKASLRALGFSFTEYPASRGARCRTLRQRGPLSEKLKMLGCVRPLRLLDNLKLSRLGRFQQGGNQPPPFVVAVEPRGVREIVKLQTSSGTFIAEGYGHHNCHFFVNPQSLMKSALAGTIDNRLNKLKRSFTMGHQQVRLWGTQFTGDGKEIMGLVCGACYQHDEDYLGPQGNKHYWRGIVVKHEVRDGVYDPMFVSLKYLLERWL